jgi:hypothetical protein
MAALAEADLLDGGSPKAATAQELTWWKSYAELDADHRRKHETVRKTRNPGIVEVSVRGGSTRNPRPIPLNPETVEAIYAAAIQAFEQAKAAARKDDLLFHALARTNLPQGKRAGIYVLGIFPIPVYRGTKFAPLYREVPVVLYPDKDAKQDHWQSGGHVPIDNNAPEADLEYLAIEYNPFFPTAKLPRNLENYSDSYRLRDTIVHEMTHAADFFRLRKHKPSGVVRREQGKAAYYNQPMEVRAFLQMLIRGLAQDLRADPSTTLDEWLQIQKKISPYWKLLTPANQRKFLQALYQAEQEIREEA